jgi:hypothetical protein
MTPLFPEYPEPQCSPADAEPFSDELTIPIADHKAHIQNERLCYFRNISKDIRMPLDQETVSALGAAANAQDIAPYLARLSLGTYAIATKYLASHPFNRDIDSVHVQRLADNFIATGRPIRETNIGLAIANGHGWLNHRNSTLQPLALNNDENAEEMYRIKQCTRLEPGAIECIASDQAPYDPLIGIKHPLAFIIKGSHRKEAVSKYSIETANPKEAYWIYDVLHPGKLNIKRLYNANRYVCSNCLDF